MNARLKGKDWHHIATIGIVLLIAVIGAGLLYWTIRSSPAVVPLVLPPAQELPTSMEKPSCTAEGTSLVCSCTTAYNVDGSCSLQSKEGLANNIFYYSATMGGTITGSLSPVAGTWSCAWERMHLFRFFVPAQNLCNNAEAQQQTCAMAARTESGCTHSDQELEVISAELAVCIMQEDELCKGTLHESDVYDVSSIGTVGDGVTP